MPTWMDGTWMDGSTWMDGQTWMDGAPIPKGPRVTYSRRRVVGRRDQLLGDPGAGGGYIVNAQGQIIAHVYGFAQVTNPDFRFVQKGALPVRMNGLGKTTEHIEESSSPF